MPGDTDSSFEPQIVKKRERRLNGIERDARVVQPAAVACVSGAIYRCPAGVNTCDRQVTNRPLCVAIGMTCAGERDIIGRWAATAANGQPWHRDVCIVVCDGLAGLAEAVTTF